MTTHTALDFADPQFRNDPYPTYAALRQDAPISRAPLGNEHVWIITRYDDVLQALKDPRLVKDFRSAMIPEQLAQMPPIPHALQLLSATMLDRDPPDHTRLRALVSKAFTPRTVEQLRPRIQQIADELLDAVQNRNEMDLIDAYAFPLPIIVITELLGIPHADRDQFRVWSNTLLQGNFTGEPSAEELTAAEAFVTYLQALIAERRAAPQPDFVTALVQAEERGDTLNEDELISMIVLLLIAGHETTVNLIGNGVLALLQHPEQLALLRRDPTLIAAAVEELLRYDSPVETSTMRFAREDLTLGGQAIQRGEMVLVVLGSANRDASQFGDADTLDITRERNRHVAFGHGIHYCLGAPLARIEGQIAINTLLRRMPELRLATDPATLHWRPGFTIRGLVTLPVAWQPGRRTTMTAHSERAALLPLATPGFRTLWIGQTLFGLAVQCYTVALVWLVLQITGSGVALGSVLIVAAIPRAVTMLVSGIVADRVQPRLLLALSALGSATLVGSIALLLAIDGLNLVALYLIVGLLGLMDAFFYPTALAQVPRLVAAERLAAANAIISTSDNIANIVGPALSGLLISTFGLPWTFVINTVLFAASSSIMWRVRRRAHSGVAQNGAPPESMGRALLAGVRFAWHHPAIRTSLLMLAMLNFAALGPVVVGLAVMAEQRFGGDAALYGLLSSSFGGGALLGGVVAGMLPPIKRPGLVLVALALGMGVGLILMGVAQALWVAFAVLALSGVGAGVVGVVAVSWLQSRTPDALQGRMASLLIFAIVAVDPFSNALAGALIDINLTTLYVVGGALMIVTGLAAWRTPAIRNES